MEVTPGWGDPGGDPCHMTVAGLVSDMGHMGRGFSHGTIHNGKKIVALPVSRNPPSQEPHEPHERDKHRRYDENNHESQHVYRDCPKHQTLCRHTPGYQAPGIIIDKPRRARGFLLRADFRSNTMLAWFLLIRVRTMTCGLFHVRAHTMRSWYTPRICAGTTMSNGKEIVGLGVYRKPATRKASHETHES